MCFASDPTETCCSIFWGSPITKLRSPPCQSRSYISAFPSDVFFIQNCDGKDCYTSLMCNTNVVRDGVSTIEVCSIPRKLFYII